MKKTPLSFLFTFLYFISLAQITFEKRYDYDFAEAAYDIQQTSDGGYILAGRQGIWIGYTNMLLIKTDSLGNEEWHRLYDAYSDQIAQAVRQTSDGGYIIAGYYNEPGIEDPRNAYVIRTNSIGDTLWTKTYGGDGIELCNDIIATEDGGYLLAGATTSFSDDGNQDVYIVKIDSVGNKLWEKAYGEEDFEISYSVKNVSDGGFIIVGYSQRPGLGAQAYLIRTDAQGDSLWTKTYGWEKAEFGRDVVETSDGGFLLTGQTANINPVINYDKFLVRVDSEGDTLWTKIIPDDDNRGENIYSVLNTPDGNFVTIGRDSREPNPLTGTTQVEMLKYDTEGNVIWRKEYGGVGSDRGYAGILTADGGFAIAGISTSDCSTCAYLIKTGPDGEITTSVSPPVINGFDIAVYPNPASLEFWIEFQSDEPGFFRIDLYDVQGRLVKAISKAFRFQQRYKEQVTVADLPPGIYLLRFVDERGGVMTKKVMIKNN